MKLRALRRGLWLGAALGGLSAPVAAQVVQGTPGTEINFGSNGVYREDPATALGRYLRVITANPRNLDALTGAGRAALEVGDAQAAIGFYARAEAIAPRNGRVKAGLGSALVLLNQEQAALGYFEDAVRLGVPEADIASDRGLAYDLRGSSRRAQRDYAVALKRGADDETTRRLALSMAISGDRDAALALLDPLLRRQDTAAWRARAFILAMTGDTAGANRAAESVMPASLAAGFAPFFRKLPSLRAGEKAAAVHFGHFPGESRPMRIDDLFNQAEVAARVALENSPRPATDAGLVDTSQNALGRVAARVPDSEGQLAATLTPRAPEQRIASVSTPRPNAINLPVGRTATATPSARQPATTTTSAATPSVAPTANRPTPAPAGVTPVMTPLASATPIDGGSSAAARVAGAATLPASTPSSAPAAGFGGITTAAFPTPKPAPVPPVPAETRLADISATVREAAREPLVRVTELPASSTPAAQPTAVAGPATGATQGPPARPLADVARAVAATGGSSTPAAGAATTTTGVPPAPKPKVEATTGARATPPASKPKVETPPTKSAAASPAKARAAQPADAKAPEASRIWVQIAGGADERAFPAEWRKLKNKAPDLLAKQTAWSTPLKATNRLLVGPFESQGAAQDFVNKLAPKGITAFAWTSPDGQAIAKLAAK